MNLYEIKYTMIFNGEEDDASGRFLKAATREAAILKFRERCPKREIVGGDYLIEGRIDSITEYRKVSNDITKKQTEDLKK